MNKPITLAIGIFLLMFSLFVACGGGGGGGGGGTPAKITESNATEISFAAYQSVSLSSNNGFSSKPSSNSNQFQSQTLIVIPFVKELLRDGRLKQLWKNDIEGDSQLYVSERLTETIYGDCGGSAIIDILITQTGSSSGDFSGVFTYDNFCLGGIYLDGDVNVSGSISAPGETSATVQITYSYQNTTLTTSCGDYTVSGTASGTTSVNYDTSSASVNMTSNMTTTENSTGKKSRIENLRITMTVTSSYASYSADGRFHHPDYGYVDISTSVTLKLWVGSMSPYQGEFLYTGDNSSAKLSVIDTGYMVEVDADGDGVYEYSENYGWSDTAACTSS